MDRWLLENPNRRFTQLFEVPGLHPTIVALHEETRIREGRRPAQGVPVYTAEPGEGEKTYVETLGRAMNEWLSGNSKYHIVATLCVTFNRESPTTFVIYQEK
jgi:hypothetical protein